MIKVLALISVCCRTCSSEQLPLCKIHRGKLPIPVTLVHVYICYLFSSIPNNTGPWIKNKGTQSKIIIVSKLKHLGWVLKRTVTSRHLLAPKTNVWTYDNNVRSEGSKEPSQRDDSFEPPLPPPPPPKKKKNIYIYTQQKKLRKSHKTMQHKNAKANNYSIFIYLFRYMSLVEKNVYFCLQAPIPLLWHGAK